MKDETAMRIFQDKATDLTREHANLKIQAENDARHLKTDERHAASTVLWLLKKKKQQRQRTAAAPVSQLRSPCAHSASMLLMAARSCCRATHC